jgi:hypothetical protein
MIGPSVAPKFDTQSFTRNDPRARQAVLSYLHRHKRAAVKVEWNKYEIDLYEHPNLWHELEVKEGWGLGKLWPRSWATVHIPNRKAHLIKERGDRLTFWVLRDDLEAAVIVNASIVGASPMVKLWNKRTQAEEPFFDVPYDSCKLVILGL